MDSRLRGVLIVVRSRAFVFVIRVCSVQQQSYSHKKCNALQDPRPCLRRCLRSKIIASQSVVWYTYTPIKKERKKEKAFGAGQFAVVCPDLLGCLGIIDFQSLRCCQSKRSRPCWHRRWWPGQPGVQRWRREQRRWSRCRRSSPAFRRPTPRWSLAWAFRHVQPSSCWRRQPSQYQRHR